MNIFVLRTASAVLASVTTVASAGVATPTFSKSFNPNTIGPDSVSTLRFDITNSSGSPVSNLAFTDNLPAGLVIATPANAITACDGIVTAPSGGGTITFADGRLGLGGACSITVDVTSGTPGPHMNVSGDLTSSAGNSGSATADLTVATDRPGSTKSFSPNSVPFGGRSTLTFTIDNTANAAAAHNLTFTDNLPSGMEVADPANAASSCAGGLLTAVPGGTVIGYGPLFFGDASVGAGATCTISIDVVGNAVGLLGNTTEPLTSTPPAGSPLRSSGKAGAILTVTNDRVFLVKRFTDDPALPGGTVTLEFTVMNLERSLSATNISFTDDLDAALSGLVATGLPLNNPCGAGSVLSGTSLLTLTGGNLGPGASCTFAVMLQVPAGAAYGEYPNTTSSVSADIDGRPVTASAATDVLFVSPIPTLTKAFVDDPVGAGGTVTLEFTITNTSVTSSATDITFQDALPSELASVSQLPASGYCGGGSTVGFLPDTGTLVFAGANLAAEDACTFQVVLDVAVGASTGTRVNTTGEITATIDGETVRGHAASDDLLIYGAPRFQKEFIDDPVAPGTVATLRFTLVHGGGEEAPPDATDIQFTDDLNATALGLTAVGLPMTDICGAGSQIDGTTQLSFTGGGLTAGESCTFDVAVQVPESVVAGAYTNTTSNLIATVGGTEARGHPAGDDLLVTGLEFSKSFVDDPVIPGDAVTLEFTLANSSGSSTATDIFFTDDLDAALDGLVGTGLPLMDVCGAGSSLVGSAGNSRLTFQGGSLSPDTSCTFSVTLQVPAGTPSGTYSNTTSQLNALIDTSPVTLGPATDQLTVNSDVLALTKEFLDDPVTPGDNVTLRFTLTNLDDSRSASDIQFTDDLDAALAGLESISGTLNDLCGAGSQVSGTGVLSFTGGNLAAGASCSFDVTLAVPAGLELGVVVENQTGTVTGMVDGLPVTGSAARDDLTVDAVTFTKAFDGPAVQGRMTTLTFTIENRTTNGVDGLGFSDDLDAVVPGLVAVGLPLNDVCGAGSSLAGTSLLTFSGGTLPPGETCAFSVNLEIPLSSPIGDFVNTTSDLTSHGLYMATAATDTLTVEQRRRPRPDLDRDGVLNFLDLCPNTPTGSEVDENGCSCDQRDGDGDGVDDCEDLCPDDPEKPAPGVCGCGVTDDDSDGDSVPDCNDQCPDTMAGLDVDEAGCPFEPPPLPDDDQDGVPNAEDLCADTEPGVPVDDTGCPIDVGPGEPDDDGDGVINDNDLCPDTPTGEAVDEEGCPLDGSGEPGDGPPPIHSLCGACGNVGMAGWLLLVLGMFGLRALNLVRRRGASQSPWRQA